jgi:NADH:ubiquinone oxidoreductase subunit 2 (subunit N)
MSRGNLLFFIIIVSGTLVSISRANWVICWIGIELRFLGIIPLLIETRRSSLRKESSLKYFCVQALGRGVLLLGGLCPFLSWGNAQELWNLVFIIGIFIKLGVFPIHFWVPRVVSGLDWIAVFFLLGWQKVAPFALLTIILGRRGSYDKMIILFGGLSAIVGALLGLNQRTLRGILGRSSIAHTGWAIIGSSLGGLWAYFFIYCLRFLLLVVSLLIKNDFFRGLSLLSLRGLPPFFMFRGKLIILKSVLSSDIWYIYLIAPLVGSILRLFFYLKFFYSFYLKRDKINNLGGLGLVSYIIYSRKSYIRGPDQ